MARLEQAGSVVWPLALIFATCLYAICIAVLSSGLSWDVPVSQLYFDATCTAENVRDCWLISKENKVLTFWLHTLPSQSVVVFGIICISGIIVAIYLDKPRYMRLAAAILIGIALTPALIAILKQFTGHYCPGQLALFGAHLKSSTLPRCFPASHPAPYFGLIALYFTRLPLLWRRIGLIAGLSIGALVSWLQIARGEHYLSHDIATLMTATYIGVWAAFVDHLLKEYDARFTR